LGDKSFSIVDRMKQLYSARNALEAHDPQFFLVAHGIDAKVTGDNNAFETFISFTPQSAPCVFVDDANFDRARELLVQFADRPSSPESPPTWTCLKCQQIVESQFDTCWKCSTPREEAPSERDLSLPIDDGEGEETPQIEAMPIEVAAPTVPSLTRRTWIVWLEVLAVVALTKQVFGGHSLAGFVIGTLGVHNTATNFYLPSILCDACDIFVILGAIHLSGDPWSAFGITKPKALDLFTGSIVCVVAIGVRTIGVDIFIDILQSVYSERDFYQLIHSPRSSYSAHGWSGFVALLVLAISVGFSEELFARGYLIPRLERLLESTWASVIASAGVFGLLHWRSGILSMCSAFLGGIVYGIAFAWSRRIWPVAIAHAAHDFSVFLSHAG
jgi:membrane protease YdiL (CAAX protease family)